MANVDDIRVDRHLDVRLISREEWDAAACIVFTIPTVTSQDGLDRLADQARLLAPGKQIIVMDAGVGMVVRGGSDAREPSPSELETMRRMAG